MYVTAAVVPVIVGVAALFVSQRSPALASRPALSALGLFLLLDILSALDTPGGDLLAPTIGVVVSVGVSVAFYIALQRRLASTGRDISR